MSARSIADLVVVGAGVMGAWTALWARRAGLATTLVDAWGGGNARATSGDESRIIRSSHGSDALYTRWARRAREHWIRLGESCGQPVFVEAGALWFAGRDDGFEAASAATLEAEDIPVERLSPVEVAARWPAVRADDLAFAVHEPEAGLLLARRGTALAARTFVAEGGRFELAHVRPGGVRDGRLVDVVADDGARIAGGAFVFACGPWLPGLFPDVLGDLIRVTKQDVLYLGPPPGDDRFGADRLPCWVDYDAAFYGLPAVDGRGAKIAPDAYGPPFDPTSGERIVDPATVEAARRYLARRFPDLAGAPVVETRVCQYESTPDTHFILDGHPSLENAWIAGGGSGHGFKHGPVIGETLVGRLTGEAEGEQWGPEEARFRLGPRVARPGMRTGAVPEGERPAASVAFAGRSPTRAAR